MARRSPSAESYPRRWPSQFKWPGYVVADNGCWEWQRVGHGGYGLPILWRGIRDRPHRVWWRMANGPIPSGDWTVDHLCRNTACVNPAHLDLVPIAENCRRGSRAKLTWEAVDAIRERFAAGEQTDALADAFGVGRRCVQSVVSRRSWVRG